MNQSQSNLKLAERGALISIVAYLILSAAKLATGHLLHSSSLVADGFNNYPILSVTSPFSSAFAWPASQLTATTDLVIGRLKI